MNKLPSKPGTPTKPPATETPSRRTSEPKTLDEALKVDPNVKIVGARLRPKT